MKNTKSRKKMLISSVAMLLVALVALGSATYAWFSVSKTVTADTMQVKAVATAGLEISIDNEATYDTSKSFTASRTSLKPVTWALGNNDGFIPDGNIASPGGAFAGDTWKDTGVTAPAAAGTGEAKGNNAYFQVYKVWVRSAAEGETRVGHDVSAKVTATGGSPDGTTFVRAYLIDESTAANSKVFSSCTTTETTTAIKATAGTTETVTSTAFGTATDVTSTGTTATGKAYTLVVWFEGTDAQCVDANKNATVDLTVSFTATDM